MPTDETTIHRGEPVSDYPTKKTLLVAQREDTIAVDGHGTLTVVERTETYFGTDLRLAGDDTTYRLVPAGFAADPMLWRARTEDGFVTGWEPLEHVTVEIVAVGDAPQCECGELLSSLRQRRMAMIGGVCPHE